MARRALLIVVSAPSGAGKTTLCDRLLAAHPGLAYSVSCTTRSPRGQERHGREYYFLTEGEFRRRLADGEFLEHAEVHGHLYGTLRSEVEARLRAGRSVLMDIDVQGAAQIRAALPCLPPDDPIRRGFVDVFIAPPSLEALRERLTKRGEDAAANIERRLRNAEGEMRRSGEYRHVVVNDRLDWALGELEAVLAAEGL